LLFQSVDVRDLYQYEYNFYMIIIITCTMAVQHYHGHEYMNTLYNVITGLQLLSYNHHNQSIIQSINQSINYLINHSIMRLLNIQNNQSINIPIKYLVSISIVDIVIIYLYIFISQVTRAHTVKLKSLLASHHPANIKPRV